MKMTKIIALTIPIAFLIMSCARPAAAAKPEVTIWSEEHLEGLWIDCSTVKPEWDFQIMWAGDVHQRITTYYNNDGGVNRITFNIHWQEIAWNTKSGLTVKDNENWQETYYPDTNTWAVSGMFLHWVIKGEGVALTETGHSTWYWDGTTWLAIKEHGVPHDLTSVYWIDFTPMCGALA